MDDVKTIVPPIGLARKIMRLLPNSEVYIIQIGSQNYFVRNIPAKIIYNDKPNTLGFLMKLKGIQSI